MMNDVMITKNTYLEDLSMSDWCKYGLGNTVDFVCKQKTLFEVMHGLDVKSWLDSIYHDAGHRQLVLPPHQSVQGSIIIVIDGNLLLFIQNSILFHNY
jgi:hypothetical protein